MLNGTNYKIVESIISISKESFFHPFRIEYTVMYQNEKEVHYIRDDRNDHSEFLTPGETLLNFLEYLVETKIMAYPFEIRDFDKGAPIDIITLYTDTSNKNIEMTNDFMMYLIEESIYETETKYEEHAIEEWVRAPHLTKLQLTFEKVSDLSSLSFQLFSRYPVNLLSLVSEEDIMGSNPPEVIDLNNVSFSTDGDTATLMFAPPIYSKRLTFVLGQFNADNNKYVAEGGLL